MIVYKMRYKKRLVWTSTVILALIAVIALAFVFNPKENRQEKDYVNKKTASWLENIKMASGIMPLSDGSDVTVELWMTEGTYYNETMDEYAPSIYTYPQNYEGNYILRTSDGDGNLLFETGLEQLWPNRRITMEMDVRILRLDFSSLPAQGDIYFLQSGRMAGWSGFAAGREKFQLKTACPGDFR